METLIRRRILRRLVWGCTVCLCPTKKDTRLIWVNIRFLQVVIQILHLQVGNYRANTNYRAITIFHTVCSSFIIMLSSQLKFKADCVFTLNILTLLCFHIYLLKELADLGLPYLINYFLASSGFCHLLVTFPNSLKISVLIWIQTV